MIPPLGFLLADDCIFYRTITCEQDHFQLQSNLNLIVKWTEVWQMGLNIRKCAILTCSRLLSPSSFAYTINSLPLTCVSQHPYLGIIFDSDMWFTPHIENIVLKGTKMLNFIRRNLKNCTMNTKDMAFISIVHPTLEYASSVWDPHTQTSKEMI